jgi:RNA recognition motif-containing protein
MKIYLGNLSRDLTDEQLKELALPFGTPLSAEVVRDRDGGGSKGFGFVEYANDAEARAAITGLNGKEVGGQVLKVSEANAKKPRPAARY